MISKFATDAASWVLGPGGDGGHGKAHATPSVNHVPTGGSEAVPVSKDADDAVRTMQKLMIDLGSQLSQPAAAQMALTKLKKEFPNIQVTAEYIQGMARKFSNTAAAGLGKSPIDGVWGQNTRNVLIIIKNFINTLGIKDILLSEGTGPSPYKTNDNILALAKQNIDNLSRLFGVFGIDTTVKEVSRNIVTMVVDMIDVNLLEDGVNNPFAHWNNHPVMVSDLTNLTSFFEFTRGLKPSFPCTPLDQISGGKKKPMPKQTVTKPDSRSQTTASFEDYIQKLANEILDKSIYRIGQEAPLAAAIVPETASDSVSDPHCVTVFDEIIKWFKDRSSQMFDSIYSSYNKSTESPRPDRKGKAGTLFDAQLADYYTRQMGKISDAWRDIRNAVIDTLRERGDSPIVTSRVLREAIGDSNSGRGKAHESRDKAHEDERGEGEGSGRTVHNQSNPPPLSSFMSMQNFEEYAPNSLEQVRQLTDGYTLPELDIRKWNSSWTTLAQEVVGKDDAEKYKNFGPWAKSIKNTLHEVYRNWKSERHNDDELKRQYDFLNRWIGRINATLGTYSDTYLELMERARRGK
jgi:hypothetical protein